MAVARIRTAGAYVRSGLPSFWRQFAAPIAPAAPTVDSQTDTSVTLNLPTSGEGDHASWQIWRSLSVIEEDFVKIDEGIITPQYTDSGLVAGTYYYALKDVDSSNNVSSLGSLLFVSIGGLLVYPLAINGFLRGLELNFPNQSATWEVTSENSLDGSFLFENGGSFKFTRGNNTGTASFSFTVFNTGISPSEYSNTVEINVQ